MLSFLEIFTPSPHPPKKKIIKKTPNKMYFVSCTGCFFALNVTCWEEWNTLKRWYGGFVAMSVPIEIVNLYGDMDMDGEYLVVRISFKNEKK